MEQFNPTVGFQAGGVGAINPMANRSSTNESQIFPGLNINEEFAIVNKVSTMGLDEYTKRQEMNNGYNAFLKKKKKEQQSLERDNLRKQIIQQNNDPKTPVEIKQQNELLYKSSQIADLVRTNAEKQGIDSSNLDDQKLLEGFFKANPNMQKDYVDFLNNKTDITNLSMKFNPEQTIEEGTTGVSGVANIPTAGLKAGLSRMGLDMGNWEWLNPIGEVATKIDELAMKIPTLTEDEWNEFSDKKLGDFGLGMGKIPTMVANIPGSFLKTLTATARGMTNPVDTMTGLFRLVGTKEGHEVLNNRYGSMDAFSSSMTQDPVGVASDVLTIIQGGAGAVSKVAGATGYSNLAKTAGNISATAGGASNLGLDLVIPAGIEKLGQISQGIPGVEQVVKYATAVQQPLKTATQTMKVIKDYVNPKMSNDDLIGHIAQVSTPEEKARISKGLQELDTKGVKTYEDGINVAKAKGKEVMDLQSQVLDLEQQKLGRTLGKADTDVIIENKEYGTSRPVNYVSEALDQLKSAYEEGGKIDKVLQVEGLMRKFDNSQLTIKEIDRIAKDYGMEIAKKAFDNQGNLKDNPKYQSFEKVRDGVKETSRKFMGEGAKLLDDSYSNIKTVQENFKKLDKKVKTLQNTLEPRGILGTLGSIGGKALDLIGMRKFLTNFLLESNKGLKKMNSLELQNNLPKYLKLFDEANKNLNKVSNATQAQNIINRLKTDLEDVKSENKEVGFNQAEQPAITKQESNINRLKQDIVKTVDLKQPIQGNYIGKEGMKRLGLMDEDGNFDPNMNRLYLDQDQMVKYKLDPNEMTFDKTKFKDITDNYKQEPHYKAYAKVGDLIKDETLYKAYPELKDVDIWLGDKDYGGGYVDRGIEKKIIIGTDLNHPRNTLIHEIQHYIQYQEGFSKGGNLGDFKTNPDMFKAMVNRERSLLIDSIEGGKIPDDMLMDAVKEIKRYEEIVKEVDNYGAGTIGQRRYMRELAKELFDETSIRGAYMGLPGEEEAFLAGGWNEQVKTKTKLDK